MPPTILAILDLFQDVLNQGKELPQTSCEVAHFLSTSSLPVSSAFWWLDTEKLEVANKDFLGIKAAEVVRPSTTHEHPPAHGEESGQVLVAMRQLPPPQCHHCPKQVPHP